MAVPSMTRWGVFECVVYHGSGTRPEAFGGATETHTIWRPVDELFDNLEKDSRPSVLLVDASMLDRIGRLHRLARRAILVAADAEAERVLGDRAHASVAGFREPADRRPFLRVACQFACSRTTAARRREQIARANREIRELHRIGMALMQERDETALLHRIVELGKRLTQSDAGGLLLAETDEDNRPRLRLVLYEFDSLPDIQIEWILAIDHSSIVGHAAATREPVVVADAYQLPPGAGFVVEPSLQERYGYRKRSMLIVPMIDHRDHMVGVLVLMNRKSDPKAKILSKEAADQYVIPYTDREVRLARALAGQAAVSMETVQLYEQIERSLESFVKAAVSAVDQRDPTTAGHSVRVAELATALAGAVERAGTGRYRGVRFSPQQLRELRFAALLHDFGKVAVREDILVKAKKLPPTLWERVNARFDLIRRTMEVESCRRNGKNDGELAKRIEELERMRAIVGEANEPTVIDTSPSRALADIAAHTFVRPNGTEATYLTPDELHYLQLPRGTLDASERAAVESHVEATYHFLEKIPWTDDLRNLAAYAYGHHEKLDGTGYPQRLHGDEIPIQTRLITVADIFDALTEGDRPYKPAVSPDTALEILRLEAREGRVDGDLVQIMVDSKVYLRVLERDWEKL